MTSCSRIGRGWQEVSHVLVVDIKQHEVDTPSHNNTITLYNPSAQRFSKEFYDRMNDCKGDVLLCSKILTGNLPLTFLIRVWINLVCLLSIKLNPASLRAVSESIPDLRSPLQSPYLQVCTVSTVLEAVAIPKDPPR